MQRFIEDDFFDDIDMPPYVPPTLGFSPSLVSQFTHHRRADTSRFLHYVTPIASTSPARRLFNQMKECLASEDTANTPYIIALSPIFSRGKITNLNEAYDFILRDIRWSNGKPSKKVRRWRAGLVEWIEDVELYYASPLDSTGASKEAGVYVPPTDDLSPKWRSKKITIAKEMEDILMRERPLSVGERDPLEPVRLHMFLGMLRAVGEAYSRHIGFTPRQSLLESIPAMLAGCTPKLVVINEKYYLSAPQSSPNALLCLRPSAISKLMKLIIKGRGPAGLWFHGENVLIQISVKPENLEDEIVSPASSKSSGSSRSSISSSWTNDTQLSSPEISPLVSKIPLPNCQPIPPTITFQAQLPTTTYPRDSPTPNISCKPESDLHARSVAALLSALPSPSVYAQPTKRPMPPGLGNDWRWWVCDHPLMLPIDEENKSAAVADVLVDLRTGRAVGVVRWL